MKILALYNGFYPEGMAMANRLHLYAKGLNEIGIEFKIIARENRGIITKKFLNNEGIEFKHVKPTSLNFKNPIIIRILNIYNYLVFYKEILKNKFDILFVISFGWLSLSIILFFIKAKKKKIIIEINEYPYITVAGRLNSKFFNNINRWILFNFIYKYIDGFFVISDALKDLIYFKTKSKGKILKIPVLVELNNSRIKYKKNNNLYIFHAGSLTPDKDGIFYLLEAFAKTTLQNGRKLKLIFSNKKTIPSIWLMIQNIIKKYKIEDLVVFNDFLSNKEVKKLMKNSYMAILYKPNNIQNRYNFSTKLGEYLSFGIPVIATEIGEMKNYLKNNKNSLLIKYGDVNLLINKMNFLLNNPEEAHRLGENGKILAQKAFYYRVHAEKIRSFLHNL